MYEPTWTPPALPGLRPKKGAPVRCTTCRVRVLRLRARTPVGREWILAAAPFAVVVLWAALTAASLLFFAVTGHRALMDACRSGSVLIGAAVLTALSLVAAGRCRV